MKNLLIIIFVAFASNIFAQTKYQSSFTTKYSSEGKIIDKKREITILDEEIKISNYVGGTNMLNLKVDSIKEKKDDLSGALMKWYYCTNTEIDVIKNEYSQYIIIIKKTYPTSMTLCKKLDEVTFLKSVFSLK
jgi:hypothetical protein